MNESYEHPSLAPERHADLLHGMYLLRSYANVSTGIKLKTEVEPLLLDVDTAVPCGLILTELLTNCFKHAFPRGRFGTITVVVHDGEVVQIDRTEKLRVPRSSTTSAPPRPDR